MQDPSAREVAQELHRRIRALPTPSIDAVRGLRRSYSKMIRDWPEDEVLAVAFLLVGDHRWVAYELVYHHRGASSQLDEATVERLGRGLSGWGDVDAFARYIAGPAWRKRLIGDDLIGRWAASPDRWWRRAALVSTVPLNLRAAGGTGDPERTIAICARLVDDRDDMVVKALSWALRELVLWDPDAVRDFLATYDGRLAARVRREVNSKLATGRKQRKRQ